MIKSCIIVAIALLPALSGLAAWEKVAYGVEANLSVIPPKEAMVGKTCRITVFFTEFVSTKGFEEFKDYAEYPEFPSVDGIPVTSAPKVKPSSTEITNNSGKQTGTNYYSAFYDSTVPEKAGEYTIENVSFTVGDKRLVAPPVTFTVNENPDITPNGVKRIHPDLRLHELQSPAKKLSDQRFDYEFDRDGSVRSPYAKSVTRNDKGQLVEEVYGAVTYKYSYNDDGLRDLWQEFDNEGHITKQFHYTYYDNFEPATETYTKWYGTEPDSPTDIVLIRYYKYEWDSHGNWVKRIAEVQNFDSLDDYTKRSMFGDVPSWYETRTIEYWE